MPYYPPNPVIESVFYLATNGILLLRKKKYYYYYDTKLKNNSHIHVCGIG